MVTYKLLLVLLCYVVKVDVSDRVIVAKGKVQEEVLGSVKVDPLLTVWIVAGYLVGLQHLSLKLLLLEQKFLHHLLANVNSIDGMLLCSLLVELFLDFADLLTLHDHYFY